jgi:hypothetical protein
LIENVSSYMEFTIGNHHTRDRSPFLAELARLERTIIEVFHDCDTTPLSASEIGRIAPAEWPLLILCTHPAVRILDCAWRVNDVLRAIANKNEWRKPDPEPTVLLVWRQRAQVFYRELEAPERPALEIASNGASLAEICAAFASHAETADPAAAINQALRRWIAHALLASDR